MGNTPSIENITHTAIEKEVVKPEVRSSDKLSSEFDIEFIQELPNNKHVVMECQECGIIFENEFEQKNHFITEHLESKVSKSRHESIDRQIKKELISIGSSFPMTMKYL